MTFAFIFETVSGGEWLVLLAVILIVVGPKNLPAAARKLGFIMSTLRRAADEFKRQIMTMDEDMRKTVEDTKRAYIDEPLDEIKGTVASSVEEAYPGQTVFSDDQADPVSTEPSYQPVPEPDSALEEVAASDSVEAAVAAAPSVPDLKPKITVS